MPLKDVFDYFGSMHFETPQHKPWRCGAWLWATNGHLLVALRDDGSDADPTPENKMKAVHYLEDKPADLTRVAMADLRVMAGVIQSHGEPCDECGGSGRQSFGEEISCEHCGQSTRPECHVCGGDGRAGLEIRYVRVAGVPVNVVLLAYGLSIVPQDQYVEIGNVVASGEHKALVVVGTGWRVVLMCCKGLTESIPYFPTAAVEVNSARDAVGKPADLRPVDLRA